MDEIARWRTADRAELFSEAASRKGVTSAIIEKDFWVCWTLGKLFTSSLLHDKILLKGGTSLSKVFGLIERFSEDIDLILNWQLVTEYDPAAERSRNQQQRFNEDLNRAAQNYIRETFLPELERMLETICIPRINGTKPHNIEIIYPATAKEQYLRPEILLEIGPLAAWDPNAEYAITPFAAEYFNDQFSSPSCMVKAIKAERTFWEKATILHHEAHRPAEKPTPTRYSRHYYDMMRMADSKIKNQAIADLGLLKDVVRFKEKFYHCGWARYDLARPGTMRLVPSSDAQRELRRDYNDMRNMIYGEPPSFDTIMSSILNLQDEINDL